MNAIDQQIASINKESSWSDVFADIGIELDKTSLTNRILDRFITQDKVCLEIKEKVKILAKENISILITGETGTGKELIAKALHGDRKGSFVAINTAGIPDNLLEAEFFGAKKGSYTGCTEDRIGYLVEARHGTIFLDEIGDMPLLLQCKILRVLQENKARRIGDTKEYNVECRFIAATNKINLLKHNCFRDDLYHRLAALVIHIPALRDRPLDIDLICNHFGVNKDQLEKKEWLGNVRELLNAIQVFKIFNKSSKG